MTGTLPRTAASPLGVHRVLDPTGSLPQAARVLDARPEIWPDEVRIDVETLNLDAASYRQLHDAHHGDGDAIRAEVLAIVGERGKMQNPVTGSGGMLIGTVAQVGPDSPLGLAPGDRAFKVERPRRGVTITRDKWGVPHVKGTTAENVAFGAGWATAADRQLIMELLRGPGRIAALDAPGVNAFGLALSGRQFRPSAAAEARRGLKQQGR